MMPEERRRRANEIARELNADRLLVADLKFALTQSTAAELITECGISPGGERQRMRYQFDNDRYRY
jgi:hypothetical protein